MMHLGLMKRFFDTVDGEWRSPLGDQIASAWVGPEADVRMLRASANFVCVVKTAGGRSFLRFNHADERTPEAIAGELAWIRHLAGGGLRVALPLSSRAGKSIESVPTELGVFHAVLFEALPGAHLGSDPLDLDGFARWGRCLGQLHQAGGGFTPANRPGWQDWQRMARAEVPETETIVRRELEAVERALAGLPAGELFGMIHYDFEQDNLCWDGLTPGVLDFDDCGPHWFAADIAFALRDLFEDRMSRVNLKDERFLAFMRGYRSQRPIDPAALGLIPLFLRWHNLISFARIARSTAGGPAAGEPDWLANLRSHLAQILDGYRREFEDHPLVDETGFEYLIERQRAD